MTSRGSGAVAVVVEDEWLVRMEIADALLEAGWEVMEATSGEAALECSRMDGAWNFWLRKFGCQGGSTGGMLQTNIARRTKT